MILPSHGRAGVDGRVGVVARPGRENDGPIGQSDGQNRKEGSAGILEIWERKELSKRDRSLVTVAALVALNRTEQLRFHLQRALENGVTEQELIEAITHLAFYSGWPTAVNAVMTAKEVFSKA
jgi:4-carboxymuconolactone decarboxylase